MAGKLANRYRAGLDWIGRSSPGWYEISHCVIAGGGERVCVTLRCLLPEWALTG